MFHSHGIRQSVDRERDHGGKKSWKNKNPIDSDIVYKHYILNKNMLSLLFDVNILVGHR